MSRPRRALLTLFLWICLGLSCLGEERRLFILHTNDIHGHIESYENGGLEKVAYVVKLFRQLFPGEVLLLDAGDTSLGTPLSGFLHGIPTAEIMANMEYDAVCLGNHEFNWGKSKMRALTNAMQAPVLCANLVTEDGGPAPYPSHTILEKNGLKIGILGMVTADTYRRAPAEATQGWHFLPPPTAAQATLAEMPEHDLTIALTHTGVPADKALVESVPQIDLVVGGHNHTPLFQALVHEGKPIVQAGCYGQYLGLLEIVVDTETKAVELVGSRLIEFTEDSPNDPEVHQLVESYAKNLRPKLKRVMAEVSSPLHRAPQENGFDTELGNFIADALREQAQTDVAFYNRGGVRFDMLAGPLTVEDVHKLFPFDDPVVVLKATGAQLRDIVEQGTIDGEGPLSPSGLKAEIKDGKVTGIRVNGKRLKKGKTYTVATTHFLSGGGDGMASFKNLRKIRRLDFTRDVLLQYLESRERIDSPGEGRFPRTD